MEYKDHCERNLREKFTIHNLPLDTMLRVSHHVELAHSKLSVVREFVRFHGSGNEDNEAVAIEQLASLLRAV